MILSRTTGKTWEQVVIDLNDIPELKYENAYGSIYPHESIFKVFEKYMIIEGKQLVRVDLQGNEAQLTFEKLK